MSRYFTSPPPVYARNWANGQNLVESTKIERQIVDSKKVHRKEKKGKKREKKQTNEISLTLQYVTPSSKQVSDESEQLEKSCLTEEHHVGYLSDGSQNSKKRRREASPVVESNVTATPVAGKPLRIRFVLKKPKEAEVVVPQEDLVCSTSGIVRPSEIASSVSGHAENQLSTSLETAFSSESKKRKKHRTSKECRYNSLFDECVLPSISMEEDDDWLFGARAQQEKSSTMKIGEGVAISLQKSGGSSLPRAQFLSDVGIFSLPYTVLF
ncbi:unnamed protein product [Thlaspi arvense]|uniref:Uncharacterized protein n=1 Tax=Thlaspi arvense TaxID=13288 RepID=A0AAU9RAH6_THLAR|nr:unnamed protein product [Thlaspi arvense]